MKLVKILALAVFAIGTCLAAWADSNANFLNDDGTITASNGGTDLTLTGSKLASVSGLGSYDCSGVAACDGTVGLTTGASRTSGSILGNATFSGTGSSFMIAGNGWTFSGSFSKVTWTETMTPTGNFWTLVGTIMGGVLKEGGVTIMSGINGATIDLTTLGGPSLNAGGHYFWTDSGGTTTIPSPVPEPGTLTLLGSGLVGIGVLAKRRRGSKKPTESE